VTRRKDAETLPLFGDEYAAAAGRDEGMARALEHAERVAAGWGARAFAALLAFVRDRDGVPFRAEQFIWWSLHNGLDEPPDRRAFGAVFLKARRDGYIAPMGYAPANTRHRAPTVLWRAA
jgi:hypothetical protein